MVVEYSHGLLKPVMDELERSGTNLNFASHSPGEILLPGELKNSFIRSLKTPTAVYLYSYFSIPRPKALLGHSHLGQLIESMRRHLSNAEEFDSLRIEAAGKESSVMQRIAGELSKELSLLDAGGNAPLVVKIRPAVFHAAGWEVLIRTTALPLSVRSWREINFPGALNGSLAAAIVGLFSHKESAVAIDPMCGTGSLLIEYAIQNPRHECTGFDLSEKMVGFTRLHLNRAGLSTPVMNASATALPLQSGSVDRIICNPPWGERIAFKKESTLYRDLLQEAARVLKPKSQMICLTQAKKPLNEALTGLPFSIKDELPVAQRGFTPSVFVIFRH